MQKLFLGWTTELK